MKAIIDLDFLDSEIDSKVRALNSSLMSLNGAAILANEVRILKLVRSKCEPIEEPKPLPTKCLNEWENPVYCPLVGYCQKCKDK